MAKDIYIKKVEVLSGRESITFEKLIDNTDNLITNADFRGTNAFKKDLNASNPPGISEDVTAGYSVGSECITTAGNIYKCVDNTEGAAVWRQTDASGGGGTSSFSIPAEGIGDNLATRSILSTNSQTYLAFSGTGAVDDAGTSFIIPADYGSGLKMYCVWVMDGTGTGQGRIALNILKQADLGLEDNGTPTETLVLLDNGQDTAAWKLQITPKVSSGQTWSAGEVCSVELERDPGHDDDTMADTFYLKALVIEYTKA